MKRIITLVFFQIILLSLSWADPIDLSTAKKAGQTYLQHWISDSQFRFNTPELELVYTAKSGISENGETNQNCFYIFNEIDKGFVIVSGDDRIQPILGYGTESLFLPQKAPPHVLAWLKEYQQQIEAALETDLPAQETHLALWEGLIKGDAPNETSRGSTVDPLVMAKWDQSPHYNALAPFDNSFNQRTVAGCVATAMAMIMKYWNYPANGAGFHSYNHSKYGVQSANFGSTTYNYAQMPNSVNSPNNAVATLMYHCGVAVDMDFGVGATGGSAAYVINAKSPIQHCAEYAFRNYFGYKPTLQGVERANYTQTNWINLIKSELDASRPVYYAGFGSGGGHAFVCDGYDNNNFFHFNWGWSGNFDGFFSINGLNPSGVGTGGGSGGFNSGHQALIGLEPLTQADPDPGPSSFNMALSNNIFSSSNPINYGDGFTISTNIANLGTNNFAGDYCAAIFDEDLNFIDYVEIKTGFVLEAGFTYTNNLTFTTQGLFSMVPGTYIIGIFYRPNGGDWVVAADNGNFTNGFTQFVVFSSSIEMFSDIVTNPFPDYIQGASASANLNLINDGSNTFTGSYQVNLYNLDGSFAQTIGTLNENNGLPPGFVYNSPFLTFTSPQLNVDPGTYLLAVLFNPAFTNDYFLVGSTNFQNPIRINVVSSGLQPDPYEANNSVSQAFGFTPSFSGQTAKILTTNSNIHEGSDLDFYRVNLPAGFNYSIQARMHDAWDSGDGKTYTVDGLFSISTNGGSTWTEAYDDIMDGPVTINNGGTVYFQAAPYFVGETGSYLLDITITRGTSSTEEPQELRNFKIYPNPVADQAYLDTDSYHGMINEILLVDQDGRKHQLNTSRIGNLITLPLGNHPVGMYYLHITTDHGTIIRKINKI